MKVKQHAHIHTEICRKYFLKSRDHEFETEKVVLWKGLEGANEMEKLYNNSILEI